LAYPMGQASLYLSACKPMHLRLAMGDIVWEFDDKQLMHSTLSSRDVFSDTPVAH